ncbi:hypothetical protein BDR04DRAFT_1078194 [Suillus decipiens]|nr:hypothetical protein BDR04DRAFT_1078194 [Suillus decipiens]
MRLLLLCVFLYLVSVVQAANTTTTISYSFEHPSFTTRTLWSIVSSSVLTLFACIYTAIHPNIPSPKDSFLLILRRRLGIMIMALIAPELIVTWAMRQWLSARHVTTQFKNSGYFKTQPQEQSENNAATAEQYVEDHDGTWLLTVHSEAPTPRCGRAHALAKPFKKFLKAYVFEQSEDYTWTETHSIFLLMGGFMLYVNGEPYLTLRRPDDILKLICTGCIDAPTLTAKQIRDKSKGNAISKGLVILQVAWFVMQFITRVIYHLKNTQLEVGTLAFAVLNFLTYAVWWNKPLDVQCPHPVYWKSTEPPATMLKDLRINVPGSDQVAGWRMLVQEIRFSFVDLMGLLKRTLTSRLRVLTFDGSIKLGDSDHTVLLLAGVLMATIFGGIHCMAWYFAFNTYQEQMLWRMSAVAIICVPWLIVLSFKALASLPKRRADVSHADGGLPNIVVKRSLPRKRAMVLKSVLTLCSVVYITARAVLLVLMFTTLRNLPPGAYKAVLWTSLVPHL